MITVIIPDSTYTVFEGICGRTGTVTNLQDGMVTVEVDGKKYISTIDDLIPEGDKEKIQDIFKKGKIAWFTRQLRKVT